MPLVNAGQRVTAGVLSEDYAQADTSNITVTAASATDITTAWSIPANDPALNTVYRLTTMGNGTWGSTQQVLNGQGKLGSTTFLTPQIGASAFAASAAIRWRMSIQVIITATGTTGTFFAEMTVCVAMNNTTWLPNNTANTALEGTVSGTGNAINTTIANNLTIQAWWASTTGAPTLTSHASIFEKLGG